MIADAVLRTVTTARGRADIPGSHAIGRWGTDLN